MNRFAVRPGVSKGTLIAALFVMFWIGGAVGVFILTTAYDPELPLIGRLIGSVLWIVAVPGYLIVRGGGDT